jgi:hypothetical protein
MAEREIIELTEVLVRITPRSALHSTPTEYRAKTRIYVTDEVSNRHPKVAELAAQEAALGDRRYSTMGQYPEVDALYRKLNRAIATAKREAARAALLEAKLIGERDRVNFSRNAGCSMCPCSPGSVLGHTITRMCVPVDIWVEPKPR